MQNFFIFFKNFTKKKMRELSLVGVFGFAMSEISDIDFEKSLLPLVEALAKRDESFTFFSGFSNGHRNNFNKL